MKSNQNRKAPTLPYAWGDLQANARGIDMLEPEANRLAPNFCCAAKLGVSAFSWKCSSPIWRK